MPQSLSKVAVHLIFSTKNGQRFIDDTERPELERYLAGILTAHDCKAIQIGAQPDHVHILFLLSRTISISDFVREVKTGSGKWLRAKGSGYTEFYWQRGYGAFSVSESVLPQVIEYVQNQDEHHRRLSFQDEFRAFCAKHGLEIDERYVWD
jgi:REP element-mobilizing transposase RayT